MNSPWRQEHGLTGVGGAQAGWLLALRSTMIALNLILIGVRVALYSAFWAQSGAVIYLLEPVLLLVIYAIIGAAASFNPTATRLVALRLGALIGLLTGLMWIANLALETFSDMSGAGSILATAPFLLGAFLLWGIAGSIVAWRTESARLGVLGAVLSGMICVLITITFGLLLTYTSLPRLQQNISADPDFLRSHWTDERAFAIANTFDSAFSHLLGALLVGLVVGAFGSIGSAILRGRLKSQR